MKRIQQWKEGLLEIIARKVLPSLGVGKEAVGAKLKHATGVIVDFLYQTLRSLQPVDYSPAKKLVIDRFLQDRRVTVYIDDLDRGWQGRSHDVARISALLNAVRDIANESRGIRFRIGLRSDVYYLVRTSDESTDKIEGSVIWQTWTNHEIFVLLVKRIETFFGRQVDCLRRDRETLPTISSRDGGTLQRLRPLG